MKNEQYADSKLQSEPTKKKRQVSFNFNSNTNINQNNEPSSKPPIGKIIKYPNKIEPFTPESHDNFANESFGTDIHKPAPIKKPLIPNQRKKSLKKQYDELTNAYSNFSRTK